MSTTHTNRLRCPKCGMPTIENDGHNTEEMALCNACYEKEEQKPMSMTHTKGPWMIDRQQHASVIHSDGRVIADVFLPQETMFATMRTASVEEYEEAEANAALIAEAGTVASETGKTPRQLAEENRTLLDAAKCALEILGAMPPDYVAAPYTASRKHAIQAAIAKAEEGD